MSEPTLPDEIERDLVLVHADVCTCDIGDEIDAPQPRCAEVRFMFKVPVFFSNLQGFWWLDALLTTNSPFCHPISQIARRMPTWCQRFWFAIWTWRAILITFARHRSSSASMKKCWCGATNPYFATAREGLDYSCDGTGILRCVCGGDFCVCHWHGEVECFGCTDCDNDDDILEDDA